LEERFGLEELKTLAFDLCGDYELFAYGGKPVFARELVHYFERRDRLHCLVTEVLKLRPDNDLRQLLAKLPPCAPDIKLQVIVALELLEDVSEVIEGLAKDLHLTEKEIMLVGLAQASIRLLVSLPERAADVAIASRIRSVDEYRITSIDLFDSLDPASQKAWRFVACNWPPDVEGNVLRPTISWEDALEAVKAASRTLMIRTALGVDVEGLHQLLAVPDLRWVYAERMADTGLGTLADLLAGEPLGAPKGTSRPGVGLEQWEHGRAFGPGLEIDWWRKGEAYCVRALAEGDLPGGGNGLDWEEGPELAATGKPRTVLLHGTLDPKWSPERPTWSEARVPRHLAYPVPVGNPSPPRRVALWAQDYERDGVVVVTRLIEVTPCQVDKEEA
jgi:hypothetical protein